MRLTADGKYQRRAIVFLNGVIVDHCTVADEEEGFVIFGKTDANGNLYIPDGHDCIQLERRLGNVDILLT